MDVWAFGLWILLLAACATQPKPEESAPTAAPPPVPAPSYSAIVAAHNSRVERLKQFYAIGVIEIRWTDRKGKHFEQGNMEVWVQQPRRTALRVEKLGEVLLWLGSNDSQYWLFDLLNDDRILNLGRHDSPPNGSRPGGLMIDIKPLALLDLLAITPIAADQNPAPAVQFNSQHNAWMLTTSGAGGPMRVFYDRQSLLPKRVETLDSAGKVVAHSTMQRYQSVKMQGVSPLAFPKLAHQIDIVVPPTSDATGGEVKIVMDNSTTVIDAAQLQGVFNLERLKQALRPGRVEEM